MRKDQDLTVRRARARHWASLTLAVAFATGGAIAIANAENGATPHSRPHNVQPAKSKSCSSSKPCLTEDNTGSGMGILAEATSGNAVEGDSSTGSGVKGTGTANAAGVYGENSGTGSGVYGYSYGGPGMYAQSHNGNALQGGSTNGDGVDGYSASGPYGVEAQAGSSSTVALGVFGDSSFSGSNNLLNVYNSDGDAMLAISDSGNEYLYGEIYTDGSCKSGCTKTRRMRAYGAESSVPTLDDVGEASLRDGRAHVAIDPALANAMDPAKPYVVLLTAEGEASLYVANRNPNGFDVAEIGGGHASVAFAYRIVAHPYGRSADQRLPFVAHARVRVPTRPRADEPPNPCLLCDT